VALWWVFFQSFDWGSATTSSRRMLLAPQQAAAKTGDGSASTMAEIWWVDLQFVAVGCGTVPLSAICINQRLLPCFVCC
jgi:hypothetical protein